MYHVHLKFHGGPLNKMQFVIEIDAAHPIVESIYFKSTADGSTLGVYSEDHRARTDDWRHFKWEWTVTPPRQDDGQANRPEGD
jgi:hypothetical protein